MPHFSTQGIESDPEGLVRLQQVLHGRTVKARAGKIAAAKPSLEERFGVHPGNGTRAARPLRLVPMDASEP